MTGIAFFDFDGTLTLKDCSGLCAVPSVQLGLLDVRKALAMGLSFIAYKCGVYPRDKAQMLALDIFTGNSLEAIENAIQLMHERVIGAWYSGTMLERVEYHKARGDLLVIATASFNLLPKPLAKDWGFDAIIGTELEFNNGICTGQPVGKVAESSEKLRLVKSFARERGVSLDDCVFYTDGVLDLPLMEAVGKPVAVGPCRRLRRIAEQRNWDIIEQTRLSNAEPDLS